MELEIIIAVSFTSESI